MLEVQVIVKIQNILLNIIDEGIYIISDVSYDPKSMYVSFSLDQINEFGATTLKIVFTSDDETIFEQNIELDGSLNNKQYFKFKIPKRKIKANKMSFKFIPIDDEAVSVDTQTMAG